MPTKNLTASHWNAEWSAQTRPPKPRFHVGEKAWYQGWILGHGVPGGAKSYYKAVRIRARLGQCYRIEYPNRKRQWVSRKSLFPIAHNEE